MKYPLHYSSRIFVTLKVGDRNWERWVPNPSDHHVVILEEDDENLNSAFIEHYL